MGLHGRNSNGPKKAPRRDARAHSSVRGITEMSAPYIDLLNGGGYWADPLDPQREAAWEVWRSRILDRWKRPGWRPSGWVAFDLPPLLDRARPWRKDVLQIWNQPSEADRQISIEEFVFALRSTSEDEREQIREGWRGCLRLADGDRKHPAASDVPPWFEADA